jgi:hypothetical protein
MKKILIAVALCAPLMAKAPQHEMETGKVISQTIGAAQAGAYAGPLGTGAVALPLYRRSNIVVIDIPGHRLTWTEIGRKMIVLPVNGQIQFYREGRAFIVLDDDSHKHKFGILGDTLQ